MEFEQYKTDRELITKEVHKYTSERKTIAVFNVMTNPHDTTIAPNDDHCSTIS